MKAIIMAAGMSTRTYPLTLTKPKPLLKVANRAILEHQLEALRGIVDAVVLVVGYKAEMIEQAYGARYKDLDLEYVFQTEQRGTGHAIAQCADRVREPFLALNGDDLYDPADLAALARTRQGAIAKSVPDPRLYGVYEVAEDGRALRLVEKPKDVFSNLANVGAYKFTPAIFDILACTEPSERNEIEITSAIQTLAVKEAFYVVNAQGYWLPIGYPWHLLDANAYLLEHHLQTDIQGEVDPAARLQGTVAIGKGSVIRSGVVIDGPVCIGEDCTIGPNCWLRPGTTLGNGCRVGQAVEIKNSIFMDGVFASHLTYIGDSVVGDRVNFGCGTITANFRHDGGNHKSPVNGVLIDTGRAKLGVIVGDGVHTGIHTSLYPGRKLWPGVCTRPGQIVDRDIVEPSSP